MSSALLVRGCEFRQDRPQIELGPGVARAIISDNIFTGPERILDRTAGKARIALNIGN